MTNFLRHTLLVGALLAAAVLGPAGGAAAAPADSSPRSATGSAGSTATGRTISGLAAKGYRVIVNRVGTASPDQCSVAQVRPGQTFSRVVPGGGGDSATTVVNRTVYLDVNC